MLISIAVSSIEWRDQFSAVVASASDQTSLHYTIALVSDNLQGVQYTCTAETEDGTIYTQTVEIQVMSELSLIDNLARAVSDPSHLPQLPVGL